MNRLSIFITLLISLTAISQVFAQPPPPFDNVVLYGNVSLSNGTPANGASYNIVVYDDNNYNVLSNVSGIVGEFVSNMIYESQNTPNSAGDIFNVTVVFLDETGKWSHVITSEERAITIVIMPDMTLQVGQNVDNDPNQFWVRTDGNDTCSGQNDMSYSMNSTDCAWASVTKAGQKLQAGQTVRVQAGTYYQNETIISYSGSEGNWIKFLGDGDVIMDGEDKTGTAIELNNKTYINITGLHIRNYNKGIDGSSDTITLHLADLLP